MKMPGFSAEAALGRTVAGYRLTPGAPMRSGGAGVMPTFRRQTIGGCGPCSELKWPNGTGTGACVQDCCDLLGNCKIQACTCGGGAAFSGGGGLALRTF
jgi:hypothetical protein